MPASDAARELDENGYVLIKNVVSAAECRMLGDELSALLNRHGSAIESASGSVVGARNLVEQWQGWRSVYSSTRLSDFVRAVVGPGAGLVRILYFDKPPGKGWSLAVHKDRTIAVSSHVENLDPFCKPTTKAGVPHVEAPVELLDTMLTLRLHLDDMHERNGPLVVYPGSHTTNSVESELETIHCRAGDVFAMRPLLSHGSRAAEPDVTDHRRVVHMELAPSDELPGNCTWRQFIRVL